MANRQRGSCAWVLGKSDRVVMLSHVIAQVHSRHSAPWEVRECHDWVVNLMDDIVESMDCA